MAADNINNDSGQAREHFNTRMQFTLNVPDSGESGEDPADVVLLDVRGAGDCAKGHLPGAINLSRKKWPIREGLNLAKLHVLYGHSKDCHLAAAAALEFARDGYSVAEMDGGFEAWKQPGFGTETSLHTRDQPPAPRDFAPPVGRLIHGSEIERLRGQLKGFDPAVRLTHGRNNIGHGRPMAIARVDRHGNLWFVTARDSAKAKEIEDNPAVQVICQDGGNRGLIVTGQAAWVRDRGTIGEPWKPAF